MTASNTETWPVLDRSAAEPTWSTLHMWLQMAGKIRLAQSPWVNHGWQVTLYLTARGLTTSPIPHGARTFQIDFDFIDHAAVIAADNGARRSLSMHPRTVADFHAELMAKLAELALGVAIDTTPCEVGDPIPFERDNVHAAYEAGYAGALWRALLQADRVFKAFRSGFAGKCSPVHLFWGGFDLAVTRFSGRPAPPHPGGIPNLPDWIVREAYSHEVSSAGFWIGGPGVPYPLFYAYAYPEPAGFGAAQLNVPGAGYDTALREFVLPYDEVRRAPSPDARLMDFLQKSYEAAASLGNWDRAALEYRQIPGHAKPSSS